MSLLVKGRRDGPDIVDVTPQSAGWKYVGFSAHRLAPGAALADALMLMERYRISGIPVVEGANGKGAGRLVGILTNRDVRFATDPEQRVAELMTKENLITVREGVGQDEAKRLLHTHRIEKLLVVDDSYRCVGLITVKDIEKAVTNPNASKDERGRLRVAAATTVGDKGFDRTERLMAAGVDLVVEPGERVADRRRNGVHADVRLPGHVRLRVRDPPGDEGNGRRRTLTVVRLASARRAGSRPMGA